MEAEFIGLSEMPKKLIWVSRIFKEWEKFNINIYHPTVLCDNQSAIQFCKSETENFNTKHIIGINL